MGCLASKEKEEPPPPPIGSTDAPAKTVDPRLPFESYRQFFQMKNSWKAISRTIPATSADTFIRFFTAHPEHQAVHKPVAKLQGEDEMKESTAFENVAAELFTTLDEAMDAMEKEKVDFAIQILNTAGQDYGRLPGFTPQYFKDLEPHFMKAVENTLDNRFNTACEQNFTRFYEFSIAKMSEAISDDNRL